MDSAYLHVITDGSVGGPRPQRKKMETTTQSAHAVEVCNPDAPANAKVLAEAKAHVLSTTICDDGSAIGGPQDRLGMLLTDLDLQHLCGRLGSLDVIAAAAELGESRPAFLTKLKGLGVDKLAERQALASGISRAKREGRLG